MQIKVLNGGKTLQYQITKQNNPLLPVEFVGRWAPKVINGQAVMYTTNLGAEVWCQVVDAHEVTVTMLDLALGAPSWLAIQIDGLPYQRVPIKSTPLRLTLDGHRHVLRLVMSGNTDEDPVWTGAGGFAVQNVATDGRLTPVQPGRHSLTFIGDSLTAGCWVAGRMPAEDYRGEANYAAIASDQLDARDVRIGYSAAGLSKPGTGGVPPLVDVLTAIDVETPWQPVPTDVVVINVGTNDGRQSAAEFTTTFRQFINQVQTLYPNSRLAVMIPFNQRFDRVIRAVVAEFMQVELVETADWPLSRTDHVHLDLAGSQVAGQQLAAALRRLYPEVFN